MSHKYFLFCTFLLALTSCSGQGENSRSLPGWAVLLLLAALIVIVWLIIRIGRKKVEEPETAEPEVEEIAAPQPDEPDELT